MSVKNTDRDINKLSDNFKLKVTDFLSEVGKTIFISESYRSKARQDYLYAQGRTNPGAIVTRTKNSNHQTGNAIDVAFFGDELYPKDNNKWLEVAKIAKKHGINWGGDWKTQDKPHFEDNGEPYIIKQDIMKQYGKLITKNELTYPKTVYGISVRLAKTNSKTLMGKANIKDYLPGCKKDEILIFENSFKKGQDFLYKILMHEFSHVIFHRYIKQEYFEEINRDDLKLTKLEYWSNISHTFNDYISDYARTSIAEDFAELVGYSHYIINGIELPEGKKFTDTVRFKYIIANNLYNSSLKKHLKLC